MSPGKGDLARQATWKAPYQVVDDFMPAEIAERMRQRIDEHFSNPGGHQAASHQVWNYWYVPKLYTYLRTTPDKVIAPADIDHFTRDLRAWSLAHLGMTDITSPYLSLYVDGCRQGLHNDSLNGSFAFVYSLTRDVRKTIGGETIIMREGDLFRKHASTANAGTGFYATIEPKFNRLVVFDDRMPHAVERLEGSMDPREGRLVLHGHIRDSGLLVTGPLPADEVASLIMDAVLSFSAQSIARLRLYHGPLVLHFAINPDGGVGDLRILVNRVVGIDASDAGSEGLIGELTSQIRAIRFPTSTGVTTVIRPFSFTGGAFR